MPLFPISGLLGSQPILLLSDFLFISKGLLAGLWFVAVLFAGYVGWTTWGLLNLHGNLVL